MSQTLAIIGFILGAIGTALGVMNSARQLWVRLRIRCYGLTMIESESKIESKFCVEITNLSAFPITVAKVGFKPKSQQLGMFTVLDSNCLDGKRLPRRVDPRDSIQVLYRNEQAETLLPQSQYVLVETACGVKRKGSLHQWKQLRTRADFDSRSK